ncbi:plasmid replication initiator TrfA [Pseudorhodoferax soli]|uniref:TrfA protein n=1 Tax=Pseudorhodoferax soli TaxID=545864 RepID=A0A368XY11_9BURK|nr:plasmid replication initiator TrfA [Pseudorhodoferax soli]RCW72881.1 TrfA protein [Pseudorhodoferax soli]
MTDLATLPKSKRKSHGMLLAGPTQLPLWGERVRGAPNALARSALFTCADKRKPRRSFDRQVIVSVAGQEIRYTGKELRQDDLTVWLQVVHLARMQPIGDQVEVSASSLGVAIGWGNSGDTYKRLRDSIARMREGSVWVDKPNGKGFSGNLIMRLEWSDAGSKSREKWRLYLDPNILELFQPDAFTLLNGEERLGLTPLAQWIYGFFSTHETPFPYKVETLFGLSGSTATCLSGFRRNLLEALDVLKERRLISDFIYDTKTKTVHVLRRPHMPVVEAPLAA